MRARGCLLACLLLVGPQLAYGAHPAVRFELDNRDLLLQVWINGRNTQLDAAVIQRNGDLWMDRDTLAAAGLRFQRDDPVGPRVDLSKLAGIHVQLDETGQRLLIDAAGDRLQPERIHVDAPRLATPDPTASGMVLNYDVTAAHDQRGGSNGGATLSAVLFRPRWRFANSGFRLYGAGIQRTVRLDSSLVMDRPDALRQWVIGDAVSDSLRWSRPVRFAGLHVGTDFSLQPQMRTFPLPGFLGSTTVPSNLDVYVNAAHVLDKPVAPGPFRVDDIPVDAGRNVATLVVRDLLGREQTQTVPFYASDRLLRPGLSDYSFDAGFLRRDYGLRSFAYGTPAALLTVRHGVHRNLTLEAHAEAGRDTALFGGGASIAVQPLGILEIDAATSMHNGRQGHLIALAASGQTRSLSLFGRFELSSRDYRDVGSLYDLAPARRRLQLGASTVLDRRGTLTASWIDVDQRVYRTQLVSLSYAHAFGDGVYVSIGSLYDRSGNDWQGQLSLTIPLGTHDLSAFARRDRRDGDAAGMTLSRPANPDGGFGYRLGAYTGPTDIREADATWNAPHATLRAGVSRIDEDTNARIGASGALVLMGSNTYAARRTGDAFAVVDAGAAGLPIYREHRPVAVTGANGTALVTDLNAYATNHLSIDPTDYPMNVIVEHPERDVVPRRDSGVRVDLAPQVAHPVLVTLQLEDGRDPPLGARVAIDGRADLLVVGRHGKVFIEDIPTPLSGTVRSGRLRCRFRIAPPPANTHGRIPTEGPIPCLQSDGRHEP
ncbi:fimbria/pilus outer membrane usher protein [Oleiagrimonas soli]|uniref:Outer membrane usher protein n=1 Tax=Oleiagrimonas soli TaxID=1543381 RepID=A0A841KUL3_9GAMM|nr:fimbria/pilus outer membrane usher protein [Oleiagrimonas soli]MBB6185608.1 outer membrane usher protein [Oleiagrimonas soli]